MGDEMKPQDNPLYGATPPPTDSSPSTLPSVSSSSPESRIPEPKPELKTTNPLFGATPPPSQVSAAPRIPTRTSRLPLSHPSGLPSYLRRLGYILSLVLGSSAVIAGIWSAFILPLLHASFSARRALVDQQKDRWTSLISGLKEVRGRSVYPPINEEVAISMGDVKDGEEKSLVLEKTGEEARLIEEESTDGEISTSHHKIEQILPLDTVSSLSTSLANLVTAFTSTSTTRTSLLSTLESYTSHLHRQLYLRSGSSFGGGGVGGGMKYGMNTLSANLAKAGGKGYGAFETDNEEAVGVKGEEWDAVRKEVRAIKGMLLSRRNFVTDEAR